MANLTLRTLTNAGDTTKGSNLSASEVDQNFINIDNELATKVSKTGDTMTGNLDFSGNALRIRGDFSNATVANRVMFQTSTTNGDTYVSTLPNGTGTVSYQMVFNNSNPTNASRAGLFASSTTVGLDSGITGSGTYLPMVFFTGGSERVRIETNGSVGVGASANGNSAVQVWQTSKSYGLEVMAATGGTNSGAASIRLINSANTVERLGIYGESDTVSSFNYPSVFRFVQGATERARLDSSGHFVPGATNSYDLGTSSLRWRNIYTQDLHLSNGIGDYTVIEGEENLYLVNNKSGKSFKFALIEVDPSEVPPKSNT